MSCSPSHNFLLALHNGLNIRVTLPNGPNSFYAQIGTTKQLQEFDNLKQELNEWAQTHPDRSTKFPDQSSYVLVQDGPTWHRAIVTDVLNRNGVKAFLIDVGRFINVYSPKKFCTSFPKLFSMAQQALKCSLVDIELNTDWTVNDAEVFESLLSNSNELLCSVYSQKQSKWHVSVYYKQAGMWKSLSECLHQLIGDKLKYSPLPQVQAYIDELNAESEEIKCSSSDDSTSSDLTLHDSNDIKPFHLSTDDVRTPLNTEEDSVHVDEVTPPHIPTGHLLPTLEEMQAMPSHDTSSHDSSSDGDDPVISEDDWKEFNEYGSFSLTTPFQREPLLDTPKYFVKDTPRPKSGRNTYKYSSHTCNTRYNKRGRKPLWYSEGYSSGRGRGRGRGEHHVGKLEYPVGGSPKYNTVDSSHMPDRSYTSDRSPTSDHNNTPVVQSDCSKPQPVSNVHTQLGLNTDEAIKNEIDWLTYRIENETKKIQSLLVQNPHGFFRSISMILNGGNAHKLSMIQSPGKPMHVVLVIMLSWILGNHDVAVDAVIQVIQELYRIFMNEVTSVYNDVCLEVFQKNLECYPVTDDVVNKRLTFCTFFVNLYLCCQKTKSFSLMDVVTDSLCSFYSYWTTKLSEMDTNENFETYVKCLCYFDTSIGMDIDKKNRKKLDKFFENVIPNILTGDLLSKSLKLDLIDVFIRRRDQWLADIHGEHPLPLDNDSCLPGASPRTMVLPDDVCADRPHPPTLVPPPGDTELPCPATSLELQYPVTSRSIDSTSSMAGPPDVSPNCPGIKPTPTVSPHEVIGSQIPQTEVKTSLEPAVSLSDITANTSPQSPSTDPYHEVSVMLSSLELSDLFTIFKSGMIRDRVLSSKKHELKKVLKEVGVPPGAVLSILNYITEHHLNTPVSYKMQKDDYQIKSHNVKSAQHRKHSKSASKRQPSTPLSPSIDLHSPISSRMEPERKLPSHSLDAYVRSKDQSLPTLDRSPQATPTMTKDNSNHEKKTAEFGSVQRCVMCGSHDHRGYSCPRRTELMFTPTD